jgi:hypothetical protein
MASTLHAALGAAAATLFFTCLGIVLTRRLVPAAVALALAPVVGWAAHSAVALPLFFAVPLSAANVVIVSALLLLAAMVAVRTMPQVAGRPDDAGAGAAGVPAWAYAAAAVLAIVPAAAILPKTAGDAVQLAVPIFDHAKVAIIDDMVKFGVPAGNPFFAGAPRLVYYYLWHFSAAELAVATGITGWEADVALTWFSAAASLAVMMGLAAWWGGREAAGLAVIFSAAASARTVLWWIFGAANVDTVVGRAAGFAGWLFQAAFAPQHIMSAACVCAAFVLIGRLAIRQHPLLVATLALLVAAGVESSTWIGGVTFAVAAPVAAAALIVRAEPRQRPRFVAALAIAAVLAAGLAVPFLRDQATAVAQRAEPALVLGFYPVLGDWFSDRLRAILDPPAFWLVLLAVELPAIYLTGLFGLGELALTRKLAPEIRCVVTALAALAAASLMVSWLIASTLGDNNDLGWRALLPAAMALTAFAAAAVARWMASRARVAVAAAVGAVVLGLPGGFELVRSDVFGDPAADGTLFAQSPELWTAVRRHAAAGERVANNPLFLADLTPWPINISWALLADRRSCFAGRELALISPSLPAGRREEIAAQFIRVFAGDASQADVAALATTYDCRVVVVTATDGAWTKDAFAASPFYRLVEKNAGRWRIYRMKAAGE